jgi:hypothetical protein
MAAIGFRTWGLCKITLLWEPALPAIAWSLHGYEKIAGMARSHATIITQ